MPEHPTLTRKEVFTTLPQLGDLWRRKGIQRARKRGLLGELRPPPGTRQRDIRPEPGVGLHDGPTSRQDTDQDSEPFLGRRVVDRFEGQVQVLPQRSQKATPR
jgi:hypothetical protein